MLVFYNVQTTSLTFVGKKWDIYEIVSDTKHNI